MINRALPINIDLNRVELPNLSMPGVLIGILGIKRKGVKELGYRGRRSYNRGPREMHKATCSDCGQECEVPFKPTEGRPVYCQE